VVEHARLGVSPRDDNDDWGNGSLNMADAYIIDAVRTPRGIGKVGKGRLAHLHPQDLGAAVLRALKDRNALKTLEVDDIMAPAIIIERV
jgi:hypothetical protein